jgi:hypothetical protein
VAEARSRCFGIVSLLALDMPDLLAGLCHLIQLTDLITATCRRSLDPWPHIASNGQPVCPPSAS